MGYDWFRCYSEILDDPKVQMMSEVDQRRLVMLFAFRCEGKPIETFLETQIAFRLRISLEELLKTKPIFIQNGFIDENWKVLNWEKRQYVSDSSTMRVRQHRQRKKQDETLHNQEGNVTETDVTENVTAQNRTDTDTEQNRKQKQKKTPPKAKPPVDARFTLFLDDFQRDFRYLNKAPAPWDAREAATLSKWLKANPTITRDQWRDILKNRRISPVSRGAPLSGWITKAISWLSGVADEWGKPIKPNGSGGHHGAVSNGTGNQILGVLQETIERRQRNRTPREAGDIPASGETGCDNTGVVHPVSAALGPESVSGGDEEYSDF